MLDQVRGDVKPEQEKEALFKKVYQGDLKKTKTEVEQIVDWMQDRYYWADVLNELRQVLIRVEQDTRTKLHTDAGVWIEQLITAAPRPEGEATQGLESPPARGMPGAPGGDLAAQEAFRRRYGLERMAPTPPPAETAPAAPGAAVPRHKDKGDTNELATLTLTFRAVSLKNVTGQADADKGIAYTVLQELQSSPLFDPDPQETHTEGDVANDEQTGTFTFSIIARLKRPLKL